MNLLKPKTLYMVDHKSSMDKGLNSNVHTRQTNPGYSRNKLGGFYTKWKRNDANTILIYNN